VPLGEDTLRRLLARGERARLSGSQRVIRESFRDAGSIYWQQSLGERDRMHAMFERAAADGAVTLMWARQGGDDRPLEFVVLRDVNQLAAFLRIPTTSIAVQQATDVLARWLDRPRVLEVLDAWRCLKKVRTLRAESAADFADALRVLDATATATDDSVARTLSVRLFGASKRIEALVTHLDVLTAESLTAPARHWSEVLGTLGIRKEPQPLLIAGVGDLHLVRGPSIAIAVPFVGVANQALTGYRGSPRWLLSIENLATFHQCAEQLAGSARGLLVFTGGMPSPSWARAYTRILKCLAEDTRIYHWGDHDEGGFRIAAHIAQIAASVGRAVQPWSMEVGEGRHASVAQHKAMIASARRASWEQLAQRLPPFLLEQESLSPTLPPSD
jgi:hypothetical protein